MVSVEFEEAYAAYRGMLGPLNIGAELAKKQFAEADVPEGYAAEALRRNIMPATIVKLCDEDIALDFVDAFLEGQEAYGISTTADAAIHIIIRFHSHFRNKEIPRVYSYPLLRIGGDPMDISEFWESGIALEYAQQIAAEKAAGRKARWT